MRTPIPDSETRRIVKALTKRWGHRLREESFQVSGWLDRREVRVTTVLRTADDAFHYPMEARVLLTGVDLEPYEAKDLALDFLDWYVGEFLDSGRDMLLPLAWEAYPFGDHEVQGRGEIRNLKLEREADDLLAGRVTADELRRRHGRPGGAGGNN